MGSPVSPYDSSAEANAAQEAMKLSEQSVTPAKPETRVNVANETGNWTLLASAKAALTSLLDSLGIQSAAPSAVTSVTYATFTEALQAAGEAKQSLQAATTFDQYAAGMQKLQDAVQGMTSHASTPDEQATAKTWSDALVAAKTTTDGITALGGIAAEDKTIVSGLQVAATQRDLGILKTSLQENKTQAATLITALDSSAPDYAVVNNLKTEITATESQADALASAIEDAQAAAEEAKTILAQAKAHSSLDAMEEYARQLAAIDQRIKEAENIAPDSPLVQGARASYTATKTEFDKIPTSVPSAGAFGPATGGSAQNRSRTVSEGRVSMLLEDLDSDTTKLVMNAFRTMIDRFNEGSGPNATELGTTLQQVESAAESLGLTETSADVLQKIKESLQDAIKNTSVGTMSEALGVVSTASASLLGASSTVATRLGGAVAGLYSSSYSSSFASTLASGFQAYEALNAAFAESNAQTRELLERVTHSSLSRRLERSNIRSDDSRPSSRVAAVIADNSRSIGEVYAGVSAVSQMLTSLQSVNPNANEKEIREKLTAAITEAPKFGYPYVQLSQDSLQKYVDALAKSFVDSERSVSETANNLFQTKSEFIQQVLVNIGSLFASYLQ